MNEPSTVHQVHRELKFRIDESTADRLERLFEGHIPVRPRFAGERGVRIRGVYLDFDDRSLTQRCLATPNESVKARYRRYENLAVPRGTIELDVMVWLEVKVRQGDLVTKERIPCRGPSLPGILERKEPPPADSPALQSLLARGALRPVAAVHYARVAFEVPGSALRLTIDRQICFQRPGQPGGLATALSVLDGCIMEIKSTGAIPPWLEAAILPLPLAAISKFEMALRAAETSG